MNFVDVVPTGLVMYGKPHNYGIARTSLSICMAYSILVLLPGLNRVHRRELKIADYIFRDMFHEGMYKYKTGEISYLYRVNRG